ncbi:unnamed protein product, partial [marine sediment metagenome]
MGAKRRRRIENIGIKITGSARAEAVMEILKYQKNRKVPEVTVAALHVLE